MKSFLYIDLNPIILTAMHTRKKFNPYVFSKYIKRKFDPQKVKIFVSWGNPKVTINKGENINRAFCQEGIDSEIIFAKFNPYKGDLVDHVIIAHIFSDVSNVSKENNSPVKVIIVTNDGDFSVIEDKVREVNPNVEFVVLGFDKRFMGKDLKKLGKVVDLKKVSGITS